jgi:two-component sensor histidine kinase
MDAKRQDTEMKTELDVEQLVSQSVKYAHDLAEIYSAEKAKRKELEALNKDLQREVRSRKMAEEELLMAQERLEERVRQRTKQLTQMNESLTREIRERKAAQLKVLEQLHEKEALLSEIHHRVKNNLQIISSLLMLQELRTEDENTLEILGDCQNRIRSMALIHERLYNTQNPGGIEFHSYLEELAAELLRAQATDCSIKLIPDLDPITVGVKIAFPCGLVVNELLSNCVKHAFRENENNEIRLSLKRNTGGAIELIVADNGVGMQEVEGVKEPSTLGLKLVRNLAEKQLKGKLLVDGSNGLKVTLTFRAAQERREDNGQG